MPSPNPGVWVEYSGNLGDAAIERTFSAQIDALKSAVKNRNDVTFLTHGRTIDEQLQVDENPPAELKVPAEPKKRGPRKPLSHQPGDVGALSGGELE